MRHPPTVDPGRCGVVTLGELLAAGWTHEAVRHAVRVGRLDRIAPGRFAPAPPESMDRFRRADRRLLHQAIAATLPACRVGISHLAGALHRGWPVWAADPHPCVTTWDPRVRLVTGVHLHRTTDVSVLVRRGEVVATSATRTIVDIAREFGTESAVVPANAALRKGAITRASLGVELAASTGLVGVDAARRLSGLLDPLSGSPLESRSRWHFDVHGIPQPESQVEIYSLQGRFLGRADHYWDEGVVGEVDGRSKYLDPDDPDTLDREKWRQQRFEDVDLEVVRWAAKDLRDFTAAAGRIERAHVRARRKHGDPRQWFAIRTGVRVPGVG